MAYHEPRQDYDYYESSEVDTIAPRIGEIVDQTIQASQNALEFAINNIGWKWLPLALLAASFIPEYHHIIKRSTGSCC